MKTKEEMKLHVFEYIELWYNHKKKGSALGYLTIDEFWKQYFIRKQLVRNIA